MPRGPVTQAVRRCQYIKASRVLAKELQQEPAVLSGNLGKSASKLELHGVVKTLCDTLGKGRRPKRTIRFVLVVQQRFEDAVRLESSTLWNLALWNALASLVAAVILLTPLWHRARSRRLEAGLSGHGE